MLVGSLRFFLLLDGGDNAPGRTSSTHDVLVGDGEQVTFIDSEFTSNLVEEQASDRPIEIIGQAILRGLKTAWEISLPSQLPIQ